MSDAPETIWVKPQHDSWNQYGHWYADSKGGGEEYTRTDTIDAIKAQVWQEAIEAAADIYEGTFDRLAGLIRAIPNPHEVKK